MSALQRYDAVQVGDTFPPVPLAFSIDADVVDAFLVATGDQGAFYGVGDNGMRRAPSMIAAVYLVSLLTARRSPPGGIHAKQAVRFHRALSVGETLTIQARVVEKYVRKERPYVVADFQAHGADGGLAASGRVTSIWGKDQ